MAVIVIILGFLAALQFLVAYCRLLLKSVSNIAVSETVRKMLGAQERAFAGDEFDRRLQFLQLCPSILRGDRVQIRLVRLYYKLLGLLHFLARLAVPPASKWLREERIACTHFIAVVIDRHIVGTRKFFERHTGNGLQE